MSVVLSNDLISVRIKDKGAELESLIHKATRLEYIWNADPAFWAKSSPVLFPIVGQLKDNQYKYRNKVYTLPRHGFARDQVFSVERQENDNAVFLFRHSEISKEVFPFDFELRIIYTIKDSTLNVEYKVNNLSTEEMYFSIGAHPAFNVPLVSGTTYADYFLEFNREENSPRWAITKEGQIGASQPFFNKTSRLHLQKELFLHDALVFKDLKSSRISLRSLSHSHGFDFSFEGFPFFGIWAAPQADFVCLEPWCGIADSVDHNQKLEEKEGIQMITKEEWKRSWSLNCY